MIDAVDKSVFLALPPADAFRLFTDRISVWWPPDRRHTGDPSSTLVLQADGRFFERAGDGREVELGKVTVWEPARRLVLDFYIPTGPEQPTEVTITFRGEEGGTRVHLRHVPTPRGRGAWERFAPRFAANWELVLAAYAAEVQASRS